MYCKRLNNKKGMILILALWAMSLLGVFSIYLGVHARQKIILLSRLETRDNLYFSAKSAVGKAICFIQKERKDGKIWNSVDSKINLMNNSDIFSNMDFKSFQAEVSYGFFDKTLNKIENRYGMIDEESKLNINTSNKNEIERLIKLLAVLDVEDSENLALAIVDWREEGQSTLEGFFSDSYYNNLKNPYSPKNGDFEIIDELLFVEGINQNLLFKLRQAFTIYGDGRVNVNTASGDVLCAIGFDVDVVRKIVSFRDGPDEKSATADDYFFNDISDFAIQVKSFESLSVNEIDRAVHIIEKGGVKTSSSFYEICAISKKKNSSYKKNVICIYDSQEKEIRYWNEI